MSWRKGDDLKRTPMSRRTVLKFLSVTVGATVLTDLVVACGDDVEGEEEGGGEHVVDMTEQFRFVPEILTISVGDTVIWRNTSSFPHTSTADPVKAQRPNQNVLLPEGAEAWDSGIIKGGEEWSRTFDVPGTYTYFCILHELMGMVAGLIVEEA